MPNREELIQALTKLDTTAFEDVLHSAYRQRQGAEEVAAPVRPEPRGSLVRTKDEAAVELACKHYQVETGMTRIFRITGTAQDEDRPNEPIKLLEVNTNTVPSGIMPLQFGPSPASGLDYPCIIMEVTPDEFEKIQTKEWTLPHEWQVGPLIPRPVEEEGQ